MFSRIQHATLLLAAMAALFALAGCGSDDPTGASEPVANVNGYLAELPEWEDFSPAKANSDVQVGDPVIEDHAHGGENYNCTTTTYDLTQNPEEITTFDPDKEILWLGALLQGDGYVNGIGSLQELPIRQRAALTVNVDFLTGNNTTSVTNPDAGSVNSAIGEIVQAATDAGHRAGSSIFFNQKETYALSQSALDLGFSARYMGTTVTGQLEYDQEFEENTLTAYFIQKMFTASVVLPQQPGNFFSSDFSASDMQAQVDRERLGPDNLPTFISSIVYGRIMMLTMTSTHSAERMRAALSASYESVTGDGGSGEVSQDDLDVLDASEIQVVTVGGEASSALALLRSGQLGDFFSSDAELTSAKAISYTVRNLADNTIAKVSETTRYNIRECSLIPRDPTGAQYTVKLESIIVSDLGCDGAFAPTPEVYYTYYVGTNGSLHDPVARRTSSNYVSLEKGVRHTLGAITRTVNLYKDGRGSFKIFGDAYDYDSGSTDELMGHWDFDYKYSNVPVGVNRRWTRSGNGCSVQLYATITKVGDLFD